MSTTTLLIVTARLRGLARADGPRRPNPPARMSGRSRTTRRIGATGIFALIRGASVGGQHRPLPAARPHVPLACAGARFPFARARVFFVISLFALLGPVLPLQSARAQPEERSGQAVEAGPAARIGGKPASGPCVIVDIAGDRAGHLDCATDRLQEAARSAQARSNAGIDADVAAAGSPDVRVGVAHQAATRLRMGDGFGHSVHSERPNRPMPMPRGGRP